MKLDKCDLDVAWSLGPGSCYSDMNTEPADQIRASIRLIEKDDLVADLAHLRTGQIKAAILRAREEDA